MTKPASHTPGKWKCERLIDRDGNPYSTLYECHIDLGPCMIWAPPGNVEQEANAKLIAAAPDLLEALQAVAEWNDNPTLEPGLPSEIELKVLSALSKAV